MIIKTFLSLIMCIFLIATLAKGNQTVRNDPGNPSKDTFIFMGYPFRFVVVTDSSPVMTQDGSGYHPDSSDYYKFAKSVSIFSLHNCQLIQTIILPPNSWEIRDDSESFIPVDLNFDRYSDFLVLQGFSPPMHLDYYLWIYDTVSKQFIRDTNIGSLSCPKVYPDSQIVTSNHIECCGICYLETYKFINGKLTLIKEERWWISVGSGKSVNQVYKVVDGSKILLEEKVSDFNLFNDLNEKNIKTKAGKTRKKRK